MFTRRASLFALAVCALLAALFVSPAASAAQESGGHAAAPAAGAAQPVERAGGEAAHGAEAAHGSEHPIRDLAAKLLNFGILVGVLVYFLKTPIAGYLSGRSAQIRQDLVAAAEMRRTATAQLEEIQKRLSKLPEELAALKSRGEEDVRNEKVRIADTARVERERLLDQTRREIAMRLRMARRELTEYAAELAVDVAHDRIQRTITPDDQLRLVDRYTAQLREAR
jgi:F-type H+-transporting ATPase subunit b